MKLITPDLAVALPRMYSQESVADPMVHVKFFQPWGGWTWYATEYDPETHTCFGLVDGLEEELGPFSLEELEGVRGPGGLTLERDMYWTPRPLSECRREFRHAKQRGGVSAPRWFTATCSCRTDVWCGWAVDATAALAKANSATHDEEHLCESDGDLAIIEGEPPAVGEPVPVHVEELDDAAGCAACGAAHEGQSPREVFTDEQLADSSGACPDCGWPHFDGPEPPPEREPRLHRVRDRMNERLAAAEAGNGN